MRDLAVERAEVFVVGPETERYAWALGMAEQYMANTVLRLTTRGGLEGVAGAAMCSSHCFDRSVAETLRYLLPEVMGASPLEREALWCRLRTLNTPLVPQAASLVDILQLPTSLTSRRGRCSYGFVLCLSPIRSLEVEAFKGLDAEGLALRGKPPRH